MKKRNLIAEYQCIFFRTVFVNLKHVLRETVLVKIAALPSSKMLYAIMKNTQMPRIVLTYGLTAILFLTASFFFDGSQDIVIHDTYYVIRNTQIVGLIAMIFGLFTLILWTVYKLKRRLINVLNWIHYSITVICFVIVPWIRINMYSQSMRYSDYSVYDEFQEDEAFLSFSEWLTIILITLMFIQLLFVFNVLWAFIRKK